MSKWAWLGLLVIVLLAGWHQWSKPFAHHEIPWPIVIAQAVFVLTIAAFTVYRFVA